MIFPMDVSGDDDETEERVLDFITTNVLMISDPLTLALIDKALEVDLPYIFTREFEADVVPQ